MSHWADSTGGPAITTSRFAGRPAGPARLEHWLVHADGRRDPLPVRRWHGPPEPATRSRRRPVHRARRSTSAAAPAGSTVALARARPGRARGGHLRRRGTSDPGPGCGSPATRRLRPTTRRRKVGARPAGRRQHRHRRRPGRLLRRCAALIAPDGHAAGRGGAAGRRAVAGTGARRLRIARRRATTGTSVPLGTGRGGGGGRVPPPPPACGSRTASDPVRAGSPSWCAHDPPTTRPHPRGLHGAVALAAGGRPARTLARSGIRAVLRHRTAQPLHPAPAGLVHLADPTGQPLPDHPGHPRALRDRRDPVAAGQAVERLPPTVRPSTAAPADPAAGHALERDLHPGAGLRRVLRAGHGPVQRRPVVPVGILLPDRRTTRWRGWRWARCCCTSR